jgi:hypothetical protein
MSVAAPNTNAGASYPGSSASTRPSSASVLRTTPVTVDVGEWDSRMQLANLERDTVLLLQDLCADLPIPSEVRAPIVPQI